MFVAIDAECTCPADVSQRRLVGMLSREGLRRTEPAVRFLVDQLAIAWEPEVAEEVMEARRVSASLVRCAAEPYAQDLVAFGVSLSEGQPISARTHRLYLAAARHLLEAAKVKRANELTQWQVARHLGRNPGNAANLQRFLSWVTDRGGISFARPRKPKVAQGRAEKALVQRTSAILERLDNAQTTSAGRALLAAAIAVLH